MNCAWVAGITKSKAPRQCGITDPWHRNFSRAYGKDKLGAIGNDTTLNAADVDGVAFILLQALEKRTDELRKENTQLKELIVMITKRHDDELRELRVAISTKSE